jgi:hypothetical protein
MVATFQGTLDDISNCLALGMIDQKRIAKALSSSISAASIAAASGDKETARNILNDFILEVNAQIEKHINGSSPRVLLAEAYSLLSQLQ